LPRQDGAVVWFEVYLDFSMVIPHFTVRPARKHWRASGHAMIGTTRKRWHDWRASIPS
jgi:hypothetical protein